MSGKEVLTDWVLEALERLGGTGSVVAVAREIWAKHEAELRAAGDLFYTWQYDMRWAATVLRKDKKLRAAEDSPRGSWEVV